MKLTRKFGLILVSFLMIIMLSSLLIYKYADPLNVFFVKTVFKDIFFNIFTEPYRNRKMADEFENKIKSDSAFLENFIQNNPAEASKQLQNLAFQKQLHYIFYSKLRPNDKVSNEQFIQDAFLYQTTSYPLLKEPSSKFYSLDRFAEVAFDSGHFQEAQKYADELIELSLKDSSSSFSAENYHNAQVILGKIALKNGNANQGKKYLEQSVDLENFNKPEILHQDLSLAEEFYKRGEKETVLNYLRKSSKYRKFDFGKNEKLIRDVENGQSPDWDQP